MPSAEDICSFAMILLKRDPVIDIDDSTISSISCKAVFSILRDEMLTQYAWTFAVGREQLQQLSSAPVNQYLYAYPLPSDCLMPLELRVSYPQPTDTSQTYYPDLCFPFRWVVEGGSILTDAPSVFLKYVQQVTEYGKWTPLATLALSYRIAGTLAMSMGGNEKLAGLLMQQSDLHAVKAQSRDAQIGTQEEFPQHDRWIRDRNSSFLSRGRGWRQGATY